jgi:hypothetical protein
MLLGLILSASACPVDSSSSSSHADGSAIHAGVAGALAAAQVDQAVADALGERFPPAPNVETLCMLRAGSTTYEAAKQLLPGRPQNESMDARSAGLAYRFSRPKDTQGSAEDLTTGVDDSSVSLYLLFKWSDGSFFSGSPAIDPSYRGYVLSEASIKGLPYPDCWPHVEE